MDSRPNIVFSTERYADLASRIASAPGFESGRLDTKRFPDGERYCRIASRVAGRDAIVIGGTITEADTLELYDLACGLVWEGVHTLSLVIPFFGYSTMERATKPGEIVVAKTRAQLLSSIPLAGSGNQVVLIDLHAEGIPHYFAGSMRPVHLYAKPVVLEQIKSVGGEDFVLGATDSGRAKWVESLALDLGVDAGFLIKRRVDGANTEVVAMAADVTGRDVVIYDDMIRTGGSLLGAARSYLDAGAKAVHAVATHGVFPAGAMKKLKDAGVLSHVAVTDTHPRAVELAAQYPDFLTVASVDRLIADFLRSRL